MHGVERTDPHHGRRASAWPVALVVDVECRAERVPGLRHLAEPASHPAELEQRVEPQPAVGGVGGELQAVVEEILGLPPLAALLVDAREVDPRAAAGPDVGQAVGGGERAFEVQLGLREQTPAIEVLREVVGARDQFLVEAEFVRVVQGGEHVHGIG